MPPQTMFFPTSFLFVSLLFALHLSALFHRHVFRRRWCFSSFLAPLHIALSFLSTLFPPSFLSLQRWMMATFPSLFIFPPQPSRFTLPHPSSFLHPSSYTLTGFLSPFFDDSLTTPVPFSVPACLTSLLVFPQPPRFTLNIRCTALLIHPRLVALPPPIAPPSPPTLRLPSHIYIHTLTASWGVHAFHSRMMQGTLHYYFSSSLIFTSSLAEESLGRVSASQSSTAVGKSPRAACEERRPLGRRSSSSAELQERK